MDFTELRRAVEEVELMDPYAHNLVHLYSNFTFIHAFSEAYGDAVPFAPHSISFKALPGGSSWTLEKFTEAFVSKLKSIAGEIYVLKSIVAYFSGLEISTNVTNKDAEEGLSQVLNVWMLLNPMTCQCRYTGGIKIWICDYPILCADLEDRRYSKCRIVLLHAPFYKSGHWFPCQATGDFNQSPDVLSWVRQRGEWLFPCRTTYFNLSLDVLS